MAYVERGTCDMPWTQCGNLATRCFSRPLGIAGDAVAILCNKHADQEHDALIAGGYAEELFW